MTTSQTAHPTEGNLLPCPFCGGDLTITKHFRDQMWQGLHRCKVVGAIQFEWTGDYNRIVTAWNTRPDVRPQGEEGLWRPISEAREDLHSHRLAWRHALELAIERADHPTDDADDRSYWRHELTVFDRVFTALSNQGKPSS